MKLKAEASGYPSWDRSPSHENRYIAEFKQKEGIILNKDSIHYNASKRGLAELCLKSMWGKLAENPMRTQTLLISDPKDLYRFLATPGIEVAKLLFAGDSECWLSWRHSDETHAPMLRHTNDVLASYLTFGGRMHLYSYLDTTETCRVHRHRQRVIYSTKRWRGTFENWRLPRRYDVRAKAVSGGHKNSAYQARNRETGAESTVCNVRGITLNYNASHLVNFERLK